ncbi:MAG TPA: hypothetical protein VNT60_06120 [Deinococcales bacterium]|nr:hypothetical protein [Deinococcales bacterium]
MRDAVHRQQQLRRRLLAAAYQALTTDSDGYLDATSIELASDDGHPDGEGGRVSFRERPPTDLEWRAAATILAEKGLLHALSLEGLARRGLPCGDLYVRLSAAGVDEFEGSVLEDARATLRPIGFRVTPTHSGGAAVRAEGQ